MPKLTDILATVPQSFIKDADVENPDEVQLEQDFANMAFMFLRDRAQALMPYLLGFEVVEREEDGSRAVGIFGFKIADKYYYVPAFFVNNQIKGMDLLYSKSTNSFMPLRETWINHILNKATLRLGEGVSGLSGIRNDFETPNFEFLAEPPYGTKYAGINHLFTKDELLKMSSGKGLWANIHAKRKRGEEPAKPGDKDYPDAKEWKKNTESKEKSASNVTSIVTDAFDVWNDLQDAVVEGLHKDAEFQQAWAGFVSKLQRKDLTLEKSANGSPIIDYMQNLGGPKSVEAFMYALQEPKYANALFSFYSGVDDFKVTEFSSDLEPIKKAQESITVTSEPTDDMTNEERSRLIRDGFSILDRRDLPEKSALFDVEYSKKFTTPTENGVYNLLLPSGNTTKAIVMHPADNQPGDFVTVVNPKSKLYFTAASDSIFVSGDKLEENISKYSDKLSSVEVGKYYTLVNDKGYCSAPFLVNSVIAENGSRTRLRIFFDTATDYSDRGVWNGVHSQLTEEPYSLKEPSIKYLQLHDGEGSLRRSGDNLVVPKNWKVIPLVNTWSCCGTSLEEDDSKAEDFSPGSLVDLHESMYKKGIHNLTIDGSDGSEFHIYFDDFKEGPYRYKQAFCRLVKNYGLAVQDAEQCLEKASLDFKSRHLIKLGQLMNERSSMTPVSAQLPPMPSFGTEDLSGMSMPEDIPYAETQEGTVLGPNSMQDTTAPGFASGGQSESEIASEIYNLAQQAAATGQKTVFDHATIGGLSRMYDASAALDMYLPDLTKSLDRLGRIIFIFYWKNQDFAERYGDEDLAEMEDLLRGVFKSFGDLLLKLKQKSITPEDASEVLSI